MKTLLIISTATCILSACSSNQPQPATSPQPAATSLQVQPARRLFASGTYVFTSESHIAFNTDTIKVAKVLSTATTYQITRKTTYQKIICGMIGPAQVLTQYCTGSYDAMTRTMFLIPSGYRLLYQKNGALELNEALYEKVE
ncbi:hypothetical protein SAMN05421788_110182 [Filimonas lacunae]|uniref:Lipoprotein n=1 Tax=Filimonas lacunae TaxID=477680 RepID=A0A173MA81_9BACT|nr:hypothetical protein [Filimonas lacunae]BAV04447.1 hypothetical protein FLA_0438 [Filimonas lacunae]SIT31464.1 hypothetical protein SAMN05421788_110182 [Filimonas lacunae]